MRGPGSKALLGFVFALAVVGTLLAVYGYLRNRSNCDGCGDEIFLVVPALIILVGLVGLGVLARSLLRRRRRR